MWNTSAISWTTDCSEHRIGVQIIKSHFFLPFSVFSPTPFISLNFGSSCLWSAGITGDCHHIAHKRMVQLLDANAGSDTVVAASCDLSSDPHTVTRPPINTYNILLFNSSFTWRRWFVRWGSGSRRHSAGVNIRFGSLKSSWSEFGKGLWLHRNIAGLHEKEAKLVGLPHFLTTCSVSSKSNFSTPHSHPWEGH